MILSYRIQLALVLYLLFMATIIVSKPSFLFKPDKSLKSFGTKKNDTIFPLWLLVFLGAFLSYYLSHVILFISEKEI